jgi:toxoflavin biosynthesis protein ToxC
MNYMASTLVDNAVGKKFTRHRGPVTCAAGVPGSSYVVTSGYDGAVARFDLRTGHGELVGYHRHLVNRITVDSRGERAATVSSDYTVMLWDLQTWQHIRVLRGHSDDVEDFAFVGESRGASVSRDWRVLLWDLERGAIIRELEGHEKDVLSVCYHDGKLITSGDDMTMRVWDANTGRLLQAWGPFASETDTCAVDVLNNRAVLGCDDGCVRLYDLSTGEAIGEVAAHTSGIKKVTISPATGDILSAAYDQRVVVWDARTLAQKKFLESRPRLWERSLNWSPDGSQVFAGTFDGTVVVWDAASGRCLDELGTQGTEAGNACLNEVSVLTCEDVVLVSDDGYIRTACLTPEEGMWLSSVEPASGRMLMNAVTADETYGLVAAGAHNHKLHLFDATPGGLENEIEIHLHEGPINSIRISHHTGFEGNCFVACYSGAVVRVARDGRVLGNYPLHGNAVKAVRLHPHRPLGVSCSADGVLVSWDLQGQLLCRYLGHMAIIDDVDIDPTGEFLASTGRDFSLKVYALDDGRLLHTVSLGRRSPKALCFYDRDTVIVTNYWGELLRVSLADGQVRRRTIARNGISSIVRRGPHVIATSYDGAVYLVRAHDLSVVRCLRAMTQRVDESGDVW